MLSEEQQAMRLTGVGGSEVAAIVGLNPYRNVFDVWRSKVEGYRQETTAAMERGNFLEDGVARWWAHRNNAQLREVGTIRHPKEPLVICTPDRLATVSGSELDLSIKVPGEFSLGHWGDDGTDEAPEMYCIQLQWELMCLVELEGISSGVIAAPIGRDLRSYPVASDPELQAMLLDEVKRFWKDYVEPKRPPPVDGSESCSEWLKSRFPKDTKDLIQAPPGAALWARTLRVARQRLAQIEAEEREARNQLIAAIGDASGLQGEGWRATYKQTKGRAVTDWESVCAEANVPKLLIEKHTKRAPYRAFRATFDDGASND